MLAKIAKSINVAVQVAVLGFEKSYRSGESIDSILGYIDRLTGLPNRRAFERDRDAFDNRYSIVMMDVDGLKWINDMHGHLEGDQVLASLASILADSVTPSGKAYRLGGDEFICAVPREQVVSVCNAVRNRVRAWERFSVSQGVVLWLVQGLTNEILKIADSAMYQSKKKGYGRITMVLPRPAGAS